jgi:hypothetical protein
VRGLIRRPYGLWPQGRICGGRKRPRLATSSWLIDGNEMFGQLAIGLFRGAPFVWWYFFVIRSRFRSRLSNFAASIII